MQQLEQLQVPAQRFGHRLNGFRVVEVAAGGRDRQQQVVADHARERLDVQGCQPQPLADGRHQFGSENTVIHAAALADVVQQRAEGEQIRAGDARRQRRRVDGGLDDTAVHRPHVGDSARRKDVAQAAAARFQVRLRALRDPAAAQPPRVGHLHQLVHPRANCGAPLPSCAGDQLLGQRRIAGNVASVQQAQGGDHVAVGDAQRAGDGAHAVVEPDVGVPQRIPQPVGDPLQHVVGDVVVQQHQVEIGIGQQLAPAQDADPDERETTGFGDAEFGGLGHQPRLVQFEPGVPQFGRVQRGALRQQRTPRSS